MNDMKKIHKRALKEYNNNNFKKALSLYLEVYPHTYSTTKNCIEHAIGLCYYSMNDYATAEMWYDKAIKEPKLQEVVFDKALSMLHQSNINGFDYYHGRYLSDNITSVRFPDLPLPKVRSMDGLKNKKILVLNEQGFGDELMFSLTHETLNEYCQEAYVQVYEQLKSYFDTNTYDKITYFTDRNFDINFVKKFDCWMPIGDLFALCVKNKSLKYKNIETTNEIIGICTSGNPKSPIFHDKKIDENKLKHLADNGVNLNPLVKSKIFKNPTINDFKDTYELLKKCKYVVSTDTAVANFAGLLNIPVYLVYKDYLDWRWKNNIFNITPIHINDVGTIK
jgi:tetratricopeptide (TPR) repeat protein